MMERPPSPRAVENRYAINWDDVSPRDDQKDLDVSGLTREDRLALGLTTPKFAHHVPEIHGDAMLALRDVLQKGGAIGRDTPKRRR